MVQAVPILVLLVLGCGDSDMGWLIIVLVFVFGWAIVATASALANRRQLEWVTKNRDYWSDQHEAASQQIIALACHHKKNRDEIDNLHRQARLQQVAVSRAMQTLRSEFADDEAGSAEGEA